jgi:hypothetical protein
MEEKEKIIMQQASPKQRDSHGWQKQQRKARK